MPHHSQFIRDQNGNPSPAGLREIGAYFHIEIHVPPVIATAMTQAGQPIPTPVAGVGLIDTGATMTCVEETILIQLGLSPISVVNAGTANGPAKQNVYPGRIVFPAQGWTTDFNGVMGVNLAGQTVKEDPTQPIIALLGRNLLEHGVLVYSGVGGFWSLSID